MITINRDKYILYMDKKNPPVANVHAGDVVCFDVIDCFSGLLYNGDRLFSTLTQSQISHISGPVYVNEAEPGDILKVTIINITLDHQGVMITVPGRGAFGSIIKKESTRVINIKDNLIYFNEQLCLQSSPMVGVIGTAPLGQPIRAGIPSMHGANMDYNRIGVGAIVYLPVAVHGALLSLGDLHALQGEGELLLCGLEIGGKVTVCIEVLKHKKLPFPMVIQDNLLSIIGIGCSMDEASKHALEKIYIYLNSILPLPQNQIGMLLSLLGNLRTCSIVNEKITMCVEFPMSILNTYGYTIP